MRSVKPRASHYRFRPRAENCLEFLEARQYLSGETGLRADYYASATALNASTLAVNALPVVSETDPAVNFASLAISTGIPTASGISARWSGQVQTQEAGSYVFSVNSGATVNLWVNGQLIIQSNATGSAGTVSGVPIALNANTLYDIRLDISETADAVGDPVSLAWQRPSGISEIIPAPQLYPFSQPMTINSGGVYVGSWENTAANSTTINIATASPVTIEDSIVRGAGVLIANSTPGLQLTVLNSSAFGLNPNLTGVAKGDFLYASSPQSLDIEYNSINNVGDYGLYVLGDNGAGSGAISILHNAMTNLDGRYSNGNGGYENFGQPTPHDIIVNGVHNASSVEIAWNQIENLPGQSYVNDVINVYNSAGTVANPILVHDNYIDGLYAINVNSQYDSGCGIITDGGSNPSTETAFVDIYNNEVVSTGNDGIAIAAGHDVSVYNNCVISSGLLSDGSSVYAANVGIYVNDYSSGGSATTYYNNGAYNNQIGWIRQPNTVFNSAPKPYENDYWFPEATPSLTYNNVSITPTVTLASETAEFATWLGKLSQNGFTAGAAALPVSAPLPPTVAPPPPVFVDAPSGPNSTSSSPTGTTSAPVTTPITTTNNPVTTPVATTPNPTTPVTTIPTPTTPVSTAPIPTTPRHRSLGHRSHSRVTEIKPPVLPSTLTRRQRNSRINAFLLELLAEL